MQEQKSEYQISRSAAQREEAVVLPYHRSTSLSGELALPYSIPEPMARGLVKLKPKVAGPSDFKTASSTFAVSMPSTNLLPPEGYALVEYFGSHDFGWLVFKLPI